MIFNFTLNLKKKGSIMRIVISTVVIFLLTLSSTSLYAEDKTFSMTFDGSDRWDSSLRGGLDGTLYMTTTHYNEAGRDLTLAYDREAILWLQDHVEGSPVIAEGNAGLYRWGSRISIYTGLPTIIGWDWHQKQQRAAVSGEVVDWRIMDLRELYSGLDPTVAREILDRYQVTYIYLGELERAVYGEQGAAKLENMVGSDLDIVYRQGPVTIYQVRRAEEGPVAERLPKSGRLWKSGLLESLSRLWIPPVVVADGPEKAPSGPLGEPVEEEPLMLAVPVDQFPVIDGRGWNKLASSNALLAVVCWWLVLSLVGLAAWPLTRRALPQFRDGGYGLAKGIGLLLISYVVWLGASLRVAPNTSLVAWIVLAGLGGCTFFRCCRRRSAGDGA